jgi:hypothetical protein
MTGEELLDLLSSAYRRSHLIGSQDNGIIAALDMEGRLFTIVNGTVLSRVVPLAIMNRTNKREYLNPGGDALWPAPEGTCFGYEYATGDWRVPPSITGAVWNVVSCSENKAVIRAEIDLVNNLQTGIPCEFERHIELECRKNTVKADVLEVIRYIGRKNLKKGEFLLAPWSLCQFDSVESGKVTLPEPVKNELWDMYDPSDSKRRINNGNCTIETFTEKRFQLGIGANIPWIEYSCPGKFIIKRYADNLPENQFYIDIADAPPEQLPSARGVKYSIYCDPSGFMEVEACGGCTSDLIPGTEMSVRIITEYYDNTDSPES